MVVFLVLFVFVLTKRVRTKIHTTAFFVLKLRSAIPNFLLVPHGNLKYDILFQRKKGHLAAVLKAVSIFHLRESTRIWQLSSCIEIVFFY